MQSHENQSPDDSSQDNEAGKPPAGPRRRDFLRYSGAAAGGGIVGAGILAQAAQPARAAETAAAGGAPAPGTLAPGTLAATPVRAPAAPLAVRGPYLSTWLPATALPATWEQFWAGHTTAIGGIARVDGVSYMFMGDPGIILNIPNGNYGTPSTVEGFEQALRQTNVTVTPTRSVFQLEGGGIGLTVEFLSPVEPGDIRRQSIPLSYIVISAHSIDGKTHDVQIYADISGEWCSGDDTQEITWAPAQVPYTSGTLQAWTVELANQQPLTEQDQQAAWGTWTWATPATSNVTWQSGEDIVVRAQFVNNGVLANTNDTDYRAIQDNWPVFGFAADFGTLGSKSAQMPLSLGIVRDPAVSYLGQNLSSLWTSYFATWQDMAAFFHGDLTAAQGRADALDAKITSEAIAAGGVDYAGLCALALRQAYGGTELVVGPDGSPWAFLKEISSDGNVSTVDVLFPASSAWIYADPGYLELLLTPVLTYAETGGWPEVFAPHDLGSAYPVAGGYPTGNSENMPMEESGNMIIMSTAYLQRTTSANASAFITKHYAILKQWADYLVANLPDPGFQNQTDDFAGEIAHSVNLALKGIIGVAAMAKIATMAGNTADASSFAASAKQFIAYWAAHAQDPSAAHLDLTYSGSDGGNGTWGTTYNAFFDSLLGTGLVPESVKAEQAAFYPTVSNLFGLPLQVPHSYAKSDWALLTAAWLSDYPVSSQLISQVYLYANTTPSRVPFSDLYDTIAGDQVGFQARPVQGGMFALLALKQKS
jgi:hypothetical protein